MTAGIDAYAANVLLPEGRVLIAGRGDAGVDCSSTHIGPPITDTCPERPQDGVPEDIRDHIRLMCDIISLGFQTDKTRVASLLLARDLSALYYSFLGVSKQHHGASHYDGEEDYQKIVRFHVTQLAYLAQRLQAMPEGESTVLDNSCLLWVSNM